MRDILVQPYGIQVWGDLLGFLVALALPGLWPGERGRQRIWVAECVLAAWGSLTELPRALYQLDMPVFVYHLVSLALALWLVRRRFDDVASFAWARVAFTRARDRMRGTYPLREDASTGEVDDMPSWDRL